MTNEEFLKEALSSEDCPPDFEKEYAFFCRYQQMELDMLRAFASVCHKNQIPYHLAYGSLLGAVRDNGQIPWDYDVDVIVPFYAKDMLYEALDRDLDGKYCYYAPEKDATYRTMFARIVPKGYPNQMLHVDVFYAIGIPDDKQEREAYLAKVRELFMARNYVLTRMSDYMYGPKRTADRLIKKIQYGIKYGKEATADHSAFFLKYDIRKCAESVVISRIAGKKIDPVEWHLRTVPYETREGTFQIPEQYEVFLNSRYGDWRAYAPVKKRIDEVLTHCKKFRFYEQKRQNPRKTGIKR